MITAGPTVVGPTAQAALAALAGPAGESAYAIAVDNGYTGTVTQWLASLIGAAGQTGSIGPAGPANSLTIGTVVTGAPGSGATVTLSGVAPSQTLNLSIPQGAQGASGPLPFSTTTNWTASTAYTSTAPASCVVYNSGLYICTTSHSSSATFDSTKWLLIGPAGVGAIPEGQCRLTYSSSSALILKPYRGNQLFIGGASYTIPSAGVTLPNTGLTAATLYYVYAYINGGNIALEAVTTGHATDTTYGHEIKSGDGSRTLVGMVYMGAGSPGTFVDSVTQRFVASWFNRQDRALQTTAASYGPSLSAATNTEISTAQRLYFVTWGDEAPDVSVQGDVYDNSAVRTMGASVAFDGTAAVRIMQSTPAAGNYGPVSARNTALLSEGYHYATPVGWSSSATTTANFDIQTFGKVRN